MRIPIYQIDAFASKPFEGNPAAVCPLNEWLSDDCMQAIAAENNLSETAFFVPSGTGYHIRWFTPVHEVRLCGHATLASAHVVFNHLDFSQDQVTFESKSGSLTVTKNNDWLEMNFPAQPVTECDVPSHILEAFKDRPVTCFKAEDYIVVFQNEDCILNADPDLKALGELDLRGVAITAPGKNYDFVSRFFAPKYGLDEDPVTGSAFTQLIPYWSQILGKEQMNAKQVSRRSGEVGCVFMGDRVRISGQAVQYLVGSIDV